MSMRTVLGGVVSFAVMFGGSAEFTSPVFTGKAAVAQEKAKPEKPKTIKVQSMKKPTFDRLTAAQEAIEL